MTQLFNVDRLAVDSSPKKLIMTLSVAMSTTIHIEQADMEQKPLSETYSNSSHEPSITITPPRYSDLPFEPVKALHIHTRSIPLFSLALPSSPQTTIHKPDSSLAYTCSRTQRSSSNCVLTNTSGTPLINTTYSSRPSRDTVLRYVNATTPQDDVKTTSKWRARNTTFRLPDGRMITWRYKKAQGCGAKGRILALEWGDGEMVAVLVRNEGIQSAESSNSSGRAWSAGNGGELVMGRCVYGESGGVSEEMVVATCLVMLEKEVERRRAVLCMVVASAMG
jgi:hypothetical protein